MESIFLRKKIARPISAYILGTLLAPLFPRPDAHGFFPRGRPHLGQGQVGDGIVIGGGLLGLEIGLKELVHGPGDGGGGRLVHHPRD